MCIRDSLWSLEKSNSLLQWQFVEKFMLKPVDLGVNTFWEGDSRNCTSNSSAARSRTPCRTVSTSYKQHTSIWTILTVQWNLLRLYSGKKVKKDSKILRSHSLREYLSQDIEGDLPPDRNLFKTSILHRCGDCGIAGKLQQCPEACQQYPRSRSIST